MPMFITALFTVDKTWKQPKCPLTDEWIKKMVTITLYARQQKRHRCIEQTFGFCGRERGWDDLGEWH